VAGSRAVAASDTVDPYGRTTRRRHLGQQRSREIVGDEVGAEQRRDVGQDDHAEPVVGRHSQRRGESGKVPVVADDAMPADTADEEGQAESRPSRSTASTPTRR
jgi:hypothetical protein